MDGWQKHEPERPLRIHQSLARDLGRAIVSGQYKPGDGLQGEMEHSKALGVSKNAYREAIRMLVAKGLLESRPKAGTHVTPRHRWNLLDPDILAWMFMGEPDRAFIRDLFELRGIIEPAAAAMAAKRRSAEQLTGMEQALDEMRRLGLRNEQGQAADRQFHRVILEATGNEALVSLAGSVGAAVQWTTHFKQRARKVPRDPVPEHAALYEAIASGDAERAREAMETLVQLALEDMHQAL